MSLHLEIASPEGMLYNDQCYLVVIPANQGEIGVMDNHESFIASLIEGEVKILDQQQNLVKSFSLNSGFAQMLEHKLVILID